MGLTYEELGQATQAEKVLVEALALLEAAGKPQAHQVRQDLARIQQQLSESKDRTPSPICSSRSRTSKPNLSSCKQN